MRFVILLKSGQEVVIPEGYYLFVGTEGTLNVVRGADWLETYSPHAWISYKEWKE